MFLSKKLFNSSVLVMKKLVLLAVIVAASCMVAVAQPRAIGGRIGWGIGASYQHGFGEKNMLQADLDIAGFYSIQGTGTYNWIFPISSWSGPGSWNWYVGGGIGAGYAWWGDWLGVARSGIGWLRGTGLGLGCGYVGVALMGGVEYNFKFPLQVFADYRPLIGPCFYGHGGGVDFYYSGLLSGALCVGARYRFGK